MDDRGILDRPAERPHVIERPAERDHAVGRDLAEPRLEPDEPARR
jgi:hypothetical protein